MSMAGLPEVKMVGTVTQDVELRFTPNGAAVANFTIACNARKYDREQQKYVDGDATFVRCQAWKDMAEHAAESLARGMRVIVFGELLQRSWETKEGEKRTSFEVRVDEVGPSIRWATAKVQKASRSEGGQHNAPAADPWGSPAGSSEPPF